MGHLGNRKTIAEIAESVELAASWQKTWGNGGEKGFRSFSHLVMHFKLAHPHFVAPQYPYGLHNILLLLNHINKMTK